MPEQNWVIVPGVSVGPIALGMSESEVRAALGKPTESRSRDGMLTLSYGSLRVFCLHGLVSMIVCELGSPVEGPHGVTAGMTWMDASRRLGELTFDEEEALWFAPDQPGILYDIARPMAPGEQPVNPPYVPELYEVSEPDTAIVRSIFVQ